MCNVSSTREEVTLLFGTNQTWFTGQEGAKASHTASPRSKMCREGGRAHPIGAYPFLRFGVGALTALSGGLVALGTESRIQAGKHPEKA